MAVPQVMHLPASPPFLSSPPLPPYATSVGLSGGCRCYVGTMEAARRRNSTSFFFNSINETNLNCHISSLTPPLDHGTMKFTIKYGAKKLINYRRREDEEETEAG